MDNKKISSLNNELPQFFLEELEQRLETDPLSVGGLYDLQETGEEEDGICIGNSSCGKNGNCTEYTYCNVVI